ncbi:ABC transporter permease subunit [Pseudofrankia sp. BMG5.36]|uniref:ABC transporter permease subunit n=1 Tax=Pseudofrankia sp. BMG5.36 TaxID=1834512 RepID=UPI0008DADE20|nr:ABC transporter permease subunit [Pseudofrankia sp. BMG5.36]OHV59283.1 hypothetical protein BCD48_41545 [Pseudofrankia sp. BMG5.36]
MTSTLSPPVATPAEPRGRSTFGRMLRAEWTKFRTLRGWVLAVLIGAALIDVVGLFAVHSTISCDQGSGKACYQPLPTGPGGQAVTDSFYFVRQPLAGDGAITVRMTSLTGHYSAAPPAPAEPSAGSAVPPATPADPGQQAGGVDATQPWSKAGIIIKASTTPGSAYAAMTATGGHGTRMQWNFTHDVAGLAGPVAAASPQWLRLTRAGDTVTGYDSADGVTWTKVATAHLAGLPATVQVGLFATSPGVLVVTESFGGSSATGTSSTATGTFDHVLLSGATTGAGWTGEAIAGDGAPGARPGGDQPGSYERAGDQIRVTGSGDIAPAVPGVSSSPAPTAAIEDHLQGVFLGLITLVVVAAMFATAEYRRGLVRVTLAAMPGRGRVLAAKAVVIGAATFAAALVAAAIAVPVGARLSRDEGSYVLPVSGPTEARVIVGTALLVAVCAVLALAVGVILRRGAAAVAAVVVGIVLPYLLGVVPALPVEAREWVLRVTPAAGFAIEQSIPRYAQVTAEYSPPAYFPLSPWAGFAVLCGYAAAALAVAYVLLRRRDA